MGHFLESMTGRLDTDINEEHRCEVTVSALNCVGHGRSEMQIQSIDFLKDYRPGQTELRFAVGLVDELRQPVVWGTVDVVVHGSNGDRMRLSSVTDYDGIAYFHLGTVERGNWSVSVSAVTHPCYLPLCNTGLDGRRATRV